MPLNDGSFLFAIFISAAMVSLVAFAVQRARIRSPKNGFERMQRLFYVPFLAIALLALLGLVILAVARLFGVSAPFPKLSGIHTGSSEGALQVATDVVSLLLVVTGFALALNVRGAAARARGWVTSLQPAATGATGGDGSGDPTTWRIVGLVVGLFALVLLLIPRLP
jgi:flagellar biosynthesis protein FlhB